MAFFLIRLWALFRQWDKSWDADSAFQHVVAV